MGNAELATACSMMKACECLYSIGWGGISKSPAYAGIGYLSQPAVFTGGGEKIDACAVGETADAVILAFRGTVLLQPDKHFCQSLRDWTNDFNFALVPAAGIPGGVHRGIAASLAELWEQFLPVLRPLVASGKPLYVTGHSKGALLACYAALRLALEQRMPPRAVYVFGSPRVGDPEFARRYDATIAEHWRFDGRNDIVPFMPQILPCVLIRKLFRRSTWFVRREGNYDYRQVGTLQYIDKGNRICGDSRALRVRRAARLLWVLLFHNLITAHLLPTGYQPGVCHETPPLYGPHVPYGNTSWIAALRCVLHYLRQRATASNERKGGKPGRS